MMPLSANIIINGSILKSFLSTVISLLSACVFVACVGCGHKQRDGRQDTEVPEETISRSSDLGTSPELPAKKAQAVIPPAESSVESSDGPGSFELAAESQSKSVKVLDFAALRTAGQEALQDGEIDAAFDYARWAMRLDSKDPQVIFLMASVLAERHRFPEAIAMLDDVAKTTPQARLPAMGQTADWLVRFGNWSEAEARYNSILKSVPNFALAHRSLASLLIRQGRRLEAQPHLDRLCRQGDVTESELVSMLSVACPLVPNEAASFEPIGVLGLSRNDVSLADWKAIQARFQNLKPEGPWESALQGRAFAVLEDRDSLQKWKRDVDASVDVSPDAWFAKGVNAVFSDEYRDAVQCFAASVLLDPTDPIVYQKLAETLVALKRTREAERVFQRAALIEQSHVAARQLTTGDGFDRQTLLELCEQLKQLQRPWESLAWREVWLTRAGADLADSEKQEIREETSRLRESLLANGHSKTPVDFLLCGISVDTTQDPDTPRGSSALQGSDL